MAGRGARAARAAVATVAAGAWWFGSRPRPGEFVLPEPVEHPLLSVTAGSGMTPVMGMLRALAQRPGRLLDAAHVPVARGDDLWR